MHTGAKLYVCPLCNKSFTRSNAVNTHLKIHCTGGVDQLAGQRRPGDWSAPAVPEKPFRCTTCRKSFTPNAHLMLHVRLYTGEKPYDCGRCSESFVRKEKLNVHMKVNERKHYFLGHSVIGMLSRLLYDIFPVCKSIPSDVFLGKEHCPQTALSLPPNNDSYSQ